MPCDEFIGFYNSYSQQELEELEYLDKAVIDAAKVMPMTQKMLITKVDGLTLYNQYS